MDFYLEFPHPNEASYRTAKWSRNLEFKVKQGHKDVFQSCVHSGCVPVDIFYKIFFEILFSPCKNN